MNDPTSLQHELDKEPDDMTLEELDDMLLPPPGLEWDDDEWIFEGGTWEEEV